MHMHHNVPLIYVCVWFCLFLSVHRCDPEEAEDSRPEAQEEVLPGQETGVCALSQLG